MGCEKATDTHTVVSVDKSVESGPEGLGDIRGTVPTLVREARTPSQALEGRTDITPAQARALQRIKSMRAADMLRMLERLQEARQQVQHRACTRGGFRGLARWEHWTGWQLSGA